MTISFAFFIIIIIIIIMHCGVWHEVHVFGIFLPCTRRRKVNVRHNSEIILSSAESADNSIQVEFGVLDMIIIIILAYDRLELIIMIIIIIVIIIIIIIWALE